MGIGFAAMGIQSAASRLYTAGVYHDFMDLIFSIQEYTRDKRLDTTWIFNSCQYLSRQRWCALPNPRVRRNSSYVYFIYRLSMYSSSIDSNVYFINRLSMYTLSIDYLRILYLYIIYVCILYLLTIYVYFIYRLSMYTLSIDYQCILYQ